MVPSSVVVDLSFTAAKRRSYLHHSEHPRAEINTTTSDWGTLEKYDKFHLVSTNLYLQFPPIDSVINYHIIHGYRLIIELVSHLITTIPFLRNSFSAVPWQCQLSPRHGFDIDFEDIRSLPFVPFLPLVHSDRRSLHFFSYFSALLRSIARTTSSCPSIKYREKDSDEVEEPNIRKCQGNFYPGSSLIYVSLSDDSTLQQ